MLCYWQRYCQKWTPDERRMRFVRDSDAPKEWNEDNSSAPEHAPFSPHGFAKYDWYMELHPLSRAVWNNIMKDWPDWPLEQYSLAELKDIRNSRPPQYYVPQRMCDVMRDKYVAWTNRRFKVAHMIEKMFERRYNSPTRGKIEHIVGTSWAAYASNTSARLPDREVDERPEEERRPRRQWRQIRHEILRSADQT